MAEGAGGGLEGPAGEGWAGVEGRTPVVDEDEVRGGMLGLADGPGLAALRPAGFGTSGAAQVGMTSAADV